MAVTRNANVIRMTADNDTISLGVSGINIAGVRLIAGADAATAVLKVTDTNGMVLVSLKAAASTTDEHSIPFRCQASTLHLDLTGTSPEVFIYLE